MVQWIQSHEISLLWLTAVSVITFVGSMIVVPLLIVRIPADYFARSESHGKSWPDHHPAVRGMLVIGKNLLGYVFIVAGILMLVLPGQGTLTILIGILFLDFPGKYRLERWVVAHGPVLRSINWLRRRAGRAPLLLEGDGAGRDIGAKGKDLGVNP
jgi:hypothetical protein